MTTALKVAHSAKKNKVVEFFERVPKLENGKPDWNAVAEQQQLNETDLSMFVFGKVAPQALEFEKSLLGACLINKDMFQAIKPIFGTEKAFYADKNQIIFDAMASLSPLPIDLNTVTEYLHRTQKLQEVGGAYHLVELTNSIGYADIEHFKYYAEVILQKKKYRDYIRIFSNGLRQCYEEMLNPFELRDTIVQTLQKETLRGGALVTQNMEDVMAEALQETEQQKICGDFLKTGDIAIWFAAQKTGKSILAVQAADCISRGKALFNGLLPNEVGAQKVAYFDFELSMRNYKKRYVDQAGKPYPFDKKNYIRKSIDKNFYEYDKLPELVMADLERCIISDSPDVIIIDNITFLSAGGTDDGEKSKMLMQNIKRLKDKHNKTFLVLAHSKKYVDTTRPLSEEDMFGSSMIGNFCTTMVGMRRSSSLPKVIYLKQCFDRDIELNFDEKKVILTYIDKVGAMVGLHLHNPDAPTEPEADHLRSFKDATSEKESIEYMQELHNAGKSYRDIAEAIYGAAQRDKKYNTVRNKLLAYQRGEGIQPELSNDIDPSVLEKLAKLENGQKDKDLPF